METKKQGLVLGILAIGSFALAGCGAGNAAAGGNNNGSAANAQVVKVEASDFKWTLDKTEFTAGRPIEFDITAKEGTHGFSIDGTSVSQPISQGQEQKVMWTPDKPGDYTIRCDNFCGSGHSGMYTVIHVK
jgi:cytochrome c oxidase subunit 2